MPGSNYMDLVESDCKVPKYTYTSSECRKRNKYGAQNSK